MNHTVPPTCTASATIDFPAVADYVAPILASLATHDMTVTPDAKGYAVASSFGHAFLEVQPGKLLVRVEARSWQRLNRMKHAVAGPIGFIAARERLDIDWHGGVAGLAPVEDLREVRVVQVRSLTRSMRRIVFEGDDLAHLDRIDQMHCRLIFAPKGVDEPVWPMLDERGHVVWPGGKLPTRVYTIRHVDADKGQLSIDFCLHAAAGPATAWALSAAPGDRVGVIGPAAGGLKPASFHVLVGDETGLPGIARILERLPDDARGVAFIEVQDSEAELALAPRAGMRVHWLHRAGAAAGSTMLLAQAVHGIAWPADRSGVLVWGGCEYRSFREIHRYLKQNVGLPASQQVLYSHWHRTLSEEQIIEIGGEAYLP
ncbi:siderophore-interacting protein [Verticiella sediminum]|uniref:Siderophore-interacting protein n=1 Tax=Verticiella sediminum TaxID=1247510 RepID=A0A556A841_9BURK|nr:siderophore-interacting protein [Verticiella sediminum]TSH89045.1 siderophore-interacting protein [Verticiella sediminum]